MKTSVIVSTYNNPLFLNWVLQGLASQVQQPEEIWIAEDGEDQKTKEMIEANIYRLPIYHVRQKDQGFRKSRILNEAIRQSSGEYVIFLDGDCIPHPYFIGDHINLAQQGYYVQGRRSFITQKGLASIQVPYKPIWFKFLKGELSGLFKSFRWPSAKIKIDQGQHGVLGCNMGIWQEDLLRVNGFNLDFEGWGREDSELVERLYIHGLKRKMVHGRAVVYHCYHPEQPRDRLDQNQNLLEEIRQKGESRCERGLEVYSS